MLMKSCVNSQVEIWRGQILEMLCSQDISGAVKRLKEALLANSRDVTILNLMANCCYILGEFAGAEWYWNEVLKFEPANKIARSKLKNIKNPAFGFWLKRYYKALDLIQVREYEQAKDILEELLKENDGFVSIYKFLGICHKELGEDEKALKMWRQGLKLDKNNEELHSFIAQSLARNDKGLAYFKQDRKEKKVREFSPYLPSGKNRIAWAVSGIIALALGVQIISSVDNRDSYRTDIDKAAVSGTVVDGKKEKAGNAVPVLSTVQAADKTDGNAKKEEIYSNKDNEIYYYTQGYKLYKKGDLKNAAVHFEKVVAINSHSYINREALYYLARVCYIQNDYNRAEQYYLTYLDLFPGSNYHDESLYYLAALYYKKGDIDKAEQMLKRLKELFPNSGYITSDLYKKIMQ